MAVLLIRETFLAIYRTLVPTFARESNSTCIQYLFYIHPFMTI